ncbi:MAG TPA: HAMP domain-containing sensor histidine kinase [Gemmatimonadaceae bacterium]|nr:HAMP domain-containing sensor histidine kinase [Gemmatimonadaceae bacterium]
MDAWARVPLDAPYPVAQAARTGEPVFVEEDTAWRDRFAGHSWLLLPNDSLAWAALPLAMEGRVLGALGLRFASVEQVGADERRFMHALAQQCAQALERARLYVEAQAANRAKSQFLAVMSHELRTPLNAIAGYAELLEMEVHGPVTEAQRDALGRLRRSQRRLLSLVNDVLNLARVESGVARYDIQPVVLDDALAELEALIAPQATQRGVRYLFRRVDRTIMVQADAERLQQIVLNLLSNAVKFTDTGGCVALECEVGASEVAVRVVDTGRGIPAEKLETIFEPFVQVNVELTRSGEGTGLGLAISRDLAHAMGGELVAESVLGQGATFILTLPRATGAPAYEAAAASMGIDPSEAAPAG